MGDNSNYELRHHWDRVAAEVRARGNRNVIAGDDTPRARYLRSIFLREFQTIAFRGRKVLEVGCGPGGNLHVASQKQPARIVGCDISKKMLDCAKANLTDVMSQLELVQTSGDTLPFADKSFDISFTVTVLQHDTEEELLATLLREICRVTKLEIFLFEDTFPRRWEKFSHVSRPVTEYQTHIENYGFRLCEVKYLNTVASDLACGAIRRITSSPRRNEGTPIPSITRKLQAWCLHLTPYLDRFSPLGIGLTEMVFRAREAGRTPS